MKSYLPIVVLISAILLGITAALNVFSKDETTDTIQRPCILKLEGYISKDTTGSVPTLYFISKDNKRFETVIDYRNCNLTENSHVEMCISSIDTSDINHRTIHISRVVSLP